MATDTCEGFDKGVVLAFYNPSKEGDVKKWKEQGELFSDMIREDIDVRSQSRPFDSVLASAIEISSEEACERITAYLRENKVPYSIGMYGTNFSAILDNKEKLKKIFEKSQRRL
jgi:hypothetical protein